MAKIRPFRGLRPAPDKAKEVASLPYDVINSAEAREMAKGKPHTFLHVVKPEIDLPEDVDLYDDKVYEKGKENLQKLIQDKVLIQDEAPCMYLYQQAMGYHKQIGLVTCASVEDYENNVIKKHEHTRADKEADRIRHVDTQNANAGPIFLTYRADEEMDKLVDEYKEKHKPIYDFVAEDGIWHTLWKIDDSKLLDKIVKFFDGMDSLYVADGHHRSASAAKVGAKRREANPNHTGDEEYNFFLAVLFPHDQLYIMDYNRVVKDLNGNSQEEFIGKIKENFEIEPLEGNGGFSPENPHEFGMYMNRKWYKLIAKPGTFDKKDPVASLDVSILQDNLLSPILGIQDPRKDKRIDFVGGIRGLEELRRRVDAGEAVAFAMRPTTIEQLMAIADTGNVMPPKSTWFEPKLRSGIVVHLLD